MARKDPMYRCAVCDSVVEKQWNERLGRWEPVSNCWKGWDIEEVYCGPKHSLIKHEIDRRKIITAN